MDAYGFVSESLTVCDFIIINKPDTLLMCMTLLRGSNYFTKGFVMRRALAFTGGS